MSEKLIIHHRDGSTTEVEPLKHWDPREPRELVTIFRKENWQLRKDLKNVEAVIKALRDLLPSKPAGEWWCSNCLAYVSGAQVTCTEHHENCGAQVEWHGGESPEVAAARAALATLDALQGGGQP